MGLTQIIKPSFFKIVLALVLILATFAIPRTIEICPDSGCFNVTVHDLGYPKFYMHEVIGFEDNFRFDILNLFYNLVIYYIISCIALSLIAKAYNKI